MGILEKRKKNWEKVFSIWKKTHNFFVCFF